MCLCVSVGVYFSRLRVDAWLTAGKPIHARDRITIKDVIRFAKGEYPRQHVIQEYPQLPDSGWNRLVGTMEVPFRRDVHFGP